MECKHEHLQREKGSFSCTHCPKKWFRCVRCGLPGWPAGHAESTGVVVRTHYKFDFETGQNTNIIAHEDTLSRWVEDKDNNGYCTTCNPNDNYAKGKPIDAN